MFRLREYCRCFPVTISVVAICFGLYLACHAYMLKTEEDYNDALWKLGSVSSLHLTTPGRPSDDDGPTGLFNLWDGQLWRIWVGCFHHGGLVHLLMNSSCVLVLGSLIESRIARWKYILFLFTACLSSSLLECLLQRDAVGFSGVACAMFGFILVLRRDDEEIRLVLPDGSVRFMFVFLIGCVVVTKLDIVPIANLAHFSGLIWGWLVGETWYGHFSRNPRAQSAFLAMHLLLLPGLYFCANPVWLGTWHWYVATKRLEVPAERLAAYRRAVELEPSLEDAWMQIALLKYKTQQLGPAWDATLQGLRRNAHSQRLLSYATFLWSRMRTKSERLRAVELMQELFGDRASEWYAAVGMLDSENRPQIDPPIPPRPRNALVLTLPGVDRVEERELTAPAIDPDSPASAVLGRPL